MNEVVVLNQFALPRNQSGGTRHVELFERLEGWCSVVVAGNRNHASQESYSTEEPIMKLVRVPISDRSSASRLNSWLVYSIRSARYIALRRKVDVVYGSTPHLLAPLVGLGLARLRGAAFVLEVRDLWPESFVSAGLLKESDTMYHLLSWIESFVAKHADAIVVVTSGWEEHLEKIGANLDKVTVISNGSSPFPKPPQHQVHLDPTGLRARGYGRIGIFAGSHGPKDGLDYVLDAARTNPDVGIVLVGDGPVKPAIMERAQQEHLTNVVFLDPVPKTQLGSLLQSCDFGVHAVSDLEVFKLGMSPNKLFDYMAASLPVVSNAGDGVAGMFKDFDMGYRTSVGDLPTAVSRIKRLSDPELEAMGSASIKNLTQNFSRKAGAVKLERVLDEALERRKK